MKSKFAFCVLISLLISTPSYAQIPTSYQRIGANSDTWRQVYQQLPDLPLENQYVSQETGKIDRDNTLVSRLIRYHVYVKGRPPVYRLDWKLTLADYLGANETMTDSRYPGADSLRKNPIDGDRAAINRLNLAQRNALIQVLVNVFNPNYQATPATTDTTPSPNATSAPRIQPRPGDAQLLKPN